MTTKRYGTHCIACGFDMEEELTAEAWQAICPCCGAQIGYTYSVNGKDLEGHKIHRQEWLESGAQWESIEDQPEGWNKEVALAQIKTNVPEEFQ